MGLESEMAKDVGYQFECKKDAMRQNQDGSWKATINIHPNDMDSQFLSDPMGQRYMAVLVPISDDETPRPKKPEPENKPSGQKTWKDMSYAQRAGILSGSNDFHNYLRVNHSSEWIRLLAHQKSGSRLEKRNEAAARLIRRLCGVTSRADIEKNHNAKDEFQKIYTDYTMWLKYEGGQAA